MKIQNVSLIDVRIGNHMQVGENSMLIQIVDPCYPYPTPFHQFKEVHQFEFLDLEAHDMPDAEEFKISDSQAEQIVQLLKHALQEQMDVVVHCHAGMCRSGAVCEVGVMLGFEDTFRYRQPNMLVKHKLMCALGMTYD